METPELNKLADELLEECVLHFDQDAVVFTETDNGLEVKREYETLRNRIYDLCDYNINGA